MEDLTNVLRLLSDPINQNLALLQGLWRAHDPDSWAGSPEIFITLGEKLLKLGEPLLAYDVVAEGSKHFAKNVHLRQVLALALARSGAAGSANAVLKQLYQEGNRDEESIGLLARTHKDLAAEAANPIDANRHLRKAYEFYTEAYNDTGGYWSAINAATLALLLGEPERAEILARQITLLCRERLSQTAQVKGERYWLLSTLGEAALLLRHWPEAEDWYGQAIEAGAGDWGNLQSTRRNAALLMQHLDGDINLIDGLFKIPSIVVFAGHMIDRPDRKAPRFPPQLEDAVAKAIRERLKAVNPGFGYASAACGADILFHEAILEMNGEAHVVLPYEKELFMKESVDIGGAHWAERFTSVVAKAADVQIASLQSRAGGAVFYDFANLILDGLAAVRAEQLQTRLVRLALWDGKPGDGMGGTASTVEHWRRHSQAVDIIDLEEILRERVQLTEQIADAPNIISVPKDSDTSKFAPEIRALLFADAQGYSKLNDEEIPRFVEHFLGLVAKLAAESAHGPLVRETWGDAFYFVFANVQDAAEFALDIMDSVRNTDWSLKNLPKLNLRIGLHAGPVYSCTNPVTQRAAYVGPHVSRAARIEPITPAGQVYASQEFAALAAAECVKAIRCEYVGQTAMAKKYGTFPTYIVRRRHEAALRLSGDSLN